MIDLRYEVVHTDGVARRLALERAANVRDLGGFQTPDGLTRFGRIMRADQLGMLSEADLAVLTGKVRVARTVDLRGLDEVAALGRGRLVEVGVEHLQLPIRDRANDPAVSEARRGRPHSESYLQQLEELAERYLAAVEALCHEAVAIVHCTAGKDRTGLTAMLVLGALGVPDECLIDDYAATARVPSEIKAASRDPKADEFWADYLQHTDTPDAQTPEQMEQTMNAVLEGIRDRWGSVPGYLGAHGGGHLPEHLRRRLL